MRSQSRPLDKTKQRLQCSVRQYQVDLNNKSAFATFSSDLVVSLLPHVNKLLKDSLRKTFS